MSTKEKAYVVTQPWFGVHALGSIVQGADVPDDPAAHIADGAIREATPDEISAGRADIVDPGTVKQFAAIARLQDAAREANPQKQGVSMLPTEEAPKGKRPAAPPAAPSAPSTPVSPPAAPAKGGASNG